MISEQPHFVYVTGSRGPEAQKWASLDNGYKREYIVAHPITNKEFLELTFEELEKKYPAPESAGI